MTLTLYRFMVIVGLFLTIVRLWASHEDLVEFVVSVVQMMGMWARIPNNVSI